MLPPVRGQRHTGQLDMVRDERWGNALIWL